MSSAIAKPRQWRRAKLNDDISGTCNHFTGKAGPRGPAESFCSMGDQRFLDLNAKMTSKTLSLQPISKAIASAFVMSRSA